MPASINGPRRNIPLDRIRPLRFQPRIEEDRASIGRDIGCNDQRGDAQEYTGDQWNIPGDRRGDNQATHPGDAKDGLD